MRFHPLLFFSLLLGAAPSHTHRSKRHTDVHSTQALRGKIWGEAKQGTHGRTDSYAHPHPLLLAAARPIGGGGGAHLALEGGVAKEGEEEGQSLPP